MSICRSPVLWASLVLILGLQPGSSRADDANKDKLAAVRAFRGRVESIAKVIDFDLNAADDKQNPDRARRLALLIAAYAQLHEEGDDLQVRATYSQVALQIAEAIKEKKLHVAQNLARRLARLEPDPKAQKGQWSAVNEVGMDDLMSLFDSERGKRRQGLNIEQGIMEMTKKGRPEQILKNMGLSEKALLMAQQTAIILEVIPVYADFAPEKVRKDWQKFAGEAKDAALELAAAIQKKDAVALTKAAVKLDSSCANCHHKFRTDVPSVPDLLGGIQDLNNPRHIRIQAIRALAAAKNRPKDALPALIEVLQDPDPSLRKEVAAGLVLMGLKGEAIHPRLNDALARAEPYVRYWYAHLLRDLPTGAAVTRLQEAMTHKNSTLALQAVELLGQLGPEAKDAVPALQQALQSKNKDIRFAAAEALSRIGSGREAAELIAALKDADPLVRGRAAVALGKLGKPAVPGLIEVLRGDQADARAAAAFALGKIGPDAKMAVPLLLEMQKGTDAYLRLTVSQALKKIEPAK